MDIVPGVFGKEPGVVSARPPSQFLHHSSQDTGADAGDVYCLFILYLFVALIFKLTTTQEVSFHPVYI